jgi:hypothetical protein
MIFVSVTVSACAVAVMYGSSGGQVNPPESSVAAENERRTIRPLIYFSEDSPAGNATVKKQIAEDLQLSGEKELPLVFGQNRIGDFTVLIIRGRKDTAGRFDHVSQLFTFLVNNGWHSRRLGYSYDRLTERLFYKSQPLELTCGKYSTYFTALAIKELGVNSMRFRKVTNYSKNWRKGHAFREMYFPELGKWVMFDLDGGVISVLNGEPLSTLELSLATDDEYEKAIQAGLEAYGRRSMDFDTGSRDYGKGPGAKSYADRLWKERRKYFAVDKRHRFTLCSPEEFTAWKKEAERRRKITVNCDPDKYRDLFYPVARRDGVPCDITMSRKVPWGLMSGLYSLEFIERRDFYVRWTGGTARLQALLLGQPRDVMLLLTLRGAPSAVTNRTLTVTVNERQVAKIVSPNWEDDFQTI